MDQEQNNWQNNNGQNNNGQNNFQPSNQSGSLKNGIESFKVGGIFSIISIFGFVFLIISIILLAASLNINKDRYGQVTSASKGITGMAMLFLVATYIVLAVGGIGTFVCAIVGLVNATSNYSNHPSNGIMIAAGVVGILCVPIASTILLFMAYGASKR